ncbi:RDD family protein [Candidatus Bathyarchaeota archaeon]|nr:RDD family protein [Candidatus Bathyarchaeota archaeon]MBS7628202.1 RDD family protein [Candidatus Bathyarchaeota archaeon]
MEAGEEEGKKTLYLASWGERIVAWIIDLLLVGIISIFLSQILRPFLRIPWFGQPRRIASPFYSIIFLLTPLWLLGSFSIGGASSIFLLIYWFVTEGLWGQSLGKRILGLKVVNLAGERAGFSGSFIESLGKAFVLPLDVIIGLIVSEGRERRQRLFNYLSDTIVIRTRGRPPKFQVEYVKT